jgi:hypothetical protein
MTGAGRFFIEEDPKYGVMVRCSDAETADQFEDFLSERNYVLFDIKFEGAEVLFYFGQASTRDGVKSLVEKFESD